jgi:hypothetical protein
MATILPHEFTDDGHRNLPAVLGGSQRYDELIADVGAAGISGGEIDDV